MSCLMSTNNTRMRRAGFAIFVLLATLSTTGQAQTEPEQVNFCDVVASPTNYDGKLLSVEAILQPGFHSLFLYRSVCPSKEGFDVTTQAILPDGWESLPNGKKVRQSIKQGRSAKVQLVGIFRSSVERGQDGQRFRFSISRIVDAKPDTSSKSRSRHVNAWLVRQTVHVAASISSCRFGLPGSVM